MKFKTNKFKKVSGDATHTVMRHEDGHTMRVEHKALSPKMRADLIALPMHSAEKQANPKLEQSKLAKGGKTEDPTQQHLLPGDAMPNKIEKEVVGKAKKYAEGGGIDPEKAKAFVADFDPKAAAEAPRAKVEQGDNYSSTALTRPSPENETDVKNRKMIQDFNNKTKPEMLAKGGKVQRFAEGTPEEPVSSRESVQDSPDQIAAVAGQSPVSADSSQDAPIAQSIGHTIGSAIKTILSPIGQAQDAAMNAGVATGEGIHSGVQGLVQGVKGQPLQAAAPNAGPAPASVPQAQQGAQPSAQAPAGPSDPYGTQAAYSTFEQGLGQAKQGLAGQMEAEKTQAGLEQQALQTQAANLQSMKDSYGSNLAALNQERAQALDAYTNQHVDPNRYWGSQSTVGKIGTVFGLLLGGMGSGIQGRENPVLQMLNNNIDRDIDAQKQELGKRNNLLEYNLRQYKNLNDATEMTKVMQTDIVINQLKQAQATAATPMAQARYQQGIGNLEMQNADRIGQLNMRKTLLGAANAGQVSPERVVALAVPESQRGEMTKELQGARTAVAARDNVLSAFDKISQTNTPGNRVLNPIQSKSQIEAYKSVLAGLSKETAGRFTEQDAEILAKILPNATDDDQTRQLKRSQMVKVLNEKMHFPALDGYGLGTPVINSGRYASDGTLRFNPQAPKLPK